MPGPNAGQGEEKLLWRGASRGETGCRGGPGVAGRAWWGHAHRPGTARACIPATGFHPPWPRSRHPQGSSQCRTQCCAPRQSLQAKGPRAKAAMHKRLRVGSPRTQPRWWRSACSPKCCVQGGLPRMQRAARKRTPCGAPLQRCAPPRTLATAPPKPGPGVACPLLAPSYTPRPPPLSTHAHPPHPPSISCVSLMPPMRLPPTVRRSAQRRAGSRGGQSASDETRQAGTERRQARPAWRPLQASQALVHAAAPLSSLLESSRPPPLLRRAPRRSVARQRRPPVAAPS